MPLPFQKRSIQPCGILQNMFYLVYMCIVIGFKTFKTLLGNLEHSICFACRPQCERISAGPCWENCDTFTEKKLGLYESPTWIVSKHRFQVSLMQGFPLFFIYQGSDSRFPKITTFCKIKTTTERVCFTLY